MNGFVKFCLLCVGLAAGLWVGNTSVFVSVSDTAQPKLIAHRAVHQVYAGEWDDDEACRAKNVQPIQHGFIENTLPSMRAAVEAGADVIELDVHLTADGAFAVFHDWTLDCQTDGTGITHDQTLADLKKLDAGFGFTADEIDYPLRGTGIGLIPSFDEVIADDLGVPLMVNFKSRRAEEGVQMAQILADQDIPVWAVYGGAPPMQEVKTRHPDIYAFNRATVLACLRRYVLIGWSGWIPDACRDTVVVVPLNVGPFVWGWPHRFVRRMESAGTDVVLFGDYDGRRLSVGIDDAATLASVPNGYSGYIWTDKIEVVGPLLKGQ